MEKSGFLKLSNDEDQAIPGKLCLPWKVLLVDDEDDVHRTTTRVLGDLVIHGRGITFLFANSQIDAVKQLEENSDIAVVLLDIMMEKDDSGFNVINFIRNSLENHLIQIIIQTGQAGYAPEKKLISEYNINNYLSKSELTAQRLYTAIISSIRAYKLSFSLQEEIKSHQKTLVMVNQLKEEAEQANLAKSRFLTNMTHELKTPMHAILGFSNIGIKKCASMSIEKHKDYYMTINLSGQRLMDLLSNLLDLSKLDVGKMDYVMKVNSIYDVVEMVMTELEPLLNKKEFKYNVQYHYEKERFVFDYYKIAQVIRNLISNVFKYSKENKQLEILVSPSQIEQNDEIIAATQVTVLDKGIGIPDDEYDIIFERFSESSRTMTSAGGKGLGLAICKKIIETHGGKIWAEPNENSFGSKFTFKIPNNLNTKSFCIGH